MAKEEISAIDQRVLDLVKKMRDIAPKESKVNQFKLAICAFILQEAGIKDDAKKLAVWKAFRSTDSGFGSNLSGFEQTFDLRVARDKIEGFTGSF